MGGGQFPYPKHVFAWSGPWWHLPANYRTNFAKVMVGVAFAAMAAVSHSKAVGVSAGRPPGGGDGRRGLTPCCFPLRAAREQKVYSPPSAQRLIDNRDPSVVARTS